MASEHHWDGLKPDPETYFGFIYVIVNQETNRKYIGKKQYFKSTGRSKSRAFDRGSPKWRSEHWAPSDWPYYKSSSKDLKADIKAGGNWDFVILAQYTNSRDLHYAEVEEQMLREVLVLVDSKGEYIYYNKAVAAVKFRPPTTHTAYRMEPVRKTLTKHGEKINVDNG